MQISLRSITEWGTGEVNLPKNWAKEAREMSEKWVDKSNQRLTDQAEKMKSKGDFINAVRTGDISKVDLTDKDVKILSNALVTDLKQLKMLNNFDIWKVFDLMKQWLYIQIKDIVYPWAPKFDQSLASWSMDSSTSHQTMKRNQSKARGYAN